MAKPAGNDGKGSGHSVGIAMVAIFAGVALVFSYAASDGMLFSQLINYSSNKDADAENTEAINENPVPTDERVFEQEPEGSTGTKPGPSAGSDATTGPVQQRQSVLSDETKNKLMQIRNFPWAIVSDNVNSSGQDMSDILQRFTNNPQPRMQQQASIMLVSGLALAAESPVHIDMTHIENLIQEIEEIDEEPALPSPPEEIDVVETFDSIEDKQLQQDKDEESTEDNNEGRVEDSTFGDGQLPENEQETSEGSNSGPSVDQDEPEDDNSGSGSNSSGSNESSDESDDSSGSSDEQEGDTENHNGTESEG